MKAATTKEVEIKQNRTIFKRKGGLVLSFLLLFCMGAVQAQVNLSGKPGLIFTPNAVAVEDGQFSFGYNYNPIRYGLRRRGTNPEQILFANVTFLKRFEVNVNFLQLRSTDTHQVREALGDRQLDLRYLILKEKPKRPSLALVLTTPFTIDGAMLTHALVATKNWTIQKDLKLEVSAGYGSPYYLWRDESNLKNSSILSNFAWQKKSEDRYKNHYLQGPFGGAILHYKSVGGLMAEFDSQHINMGAYVKLWDRWTIQGALLNFDQVSFGTSFALSLLKPSKRLKLQSHERE
ncbi:exopolysaccharide biosynthesis protein YbjH [Dyadobacter jejuensis]|uniref:Exopolysaccharide biosynthesis protein YbjH n=1 Tax=Dyadobacter jejuensis TaxID=1082580 RepID=A0A316B0E7_9BACT|nr:YjbH domain-containing protein [Dyadobacter jejuensis]PWJ55977.1 exopolysaccharide biosynthesis protein YbjH [Dyadobacter jejuensis]